MSKLELTLSGQETLEEYELILSLDQLREKHRELLLHPEEFFSQLLRSSGHLVNELFLVRPSGASPKLSSSQNLSQIKIIKVWHSGPKTPNPSRWNALVKFDMPTERSAPGVYRTGDVTVERFSGQLELSAEDIPLFLNEPDIFLRGLLESTGRPVNNVVYLGKSNRQGMGSQGTADKPRDITIPIPIAVGPIVIIIIVGATHFDSGGMASTWWVWID
jgi:hypothetical protein